MSNPKEKIFMLYYGGLMNGPAYDDFKKYVEEKLGSGPKIEYNKYIYWIRLTGARAYIFGTLEDTIWTVEKITTKIRKNVPNIGSFFIVEIQDKPTNGYMDQDFWDFFKNVQDLTKHTVNRRRGIKLKKLKALIDKKEELKRKDAELKIREQELIKKKFILNEEEELLKKEEEIRKQEEEFLKKEIALNKRKKFLGIF